MRNYLSTLWAIFTSNKCLFAVFSFRPDEKVSFLSFRSPSSSRNDENLFKFIEKIISRLFTFTFWFFYEKKFFPDSNRCFFCDFDRSRSNKWNLLIFSSVEIRMYRNVFRIFLLTICLTNFAENLRWVDRRKVERRSLTFFIVSKTFFCGRTDAQRCSSVFQVETKFGRRFFLRRFSRAVEFN